MVDITNIDPNPVYTNQLGVIIYGLDFLASGATVEFCDGPDYDTAITKVTQTITDQTDTIITVDTDMTGIDLLKQLYVFVTDNLSQRNTEPYLLQHSGASVIYSIVPNQIYHNLPGIDINGYGFGSTGAFIEICNDSVYEASTIRHTQIVTYQDNTKLTFTANIPNFIGLGYVFVTNALGQRMFIGTQIRLIVPNKDTHPYGGYGQAASGRHQFGSPESCIEPRLEDVFPPDESTGISVKTYINFEVYYYSSILDFQGDTLIEISENAGVDYVVVEEPNYQLSYCMRDSQTVWVRIQKLNGFWPSNMEIKVRFTGFDEFGQTVSKEVPVMWDNS